MQLWVVPLAVDKPPIRGRVVSVIRSADGRLRTFWYLRVGGRRFVCSNSSVGDIAVAFYFRLSSPSEPSSHRCVQDEERRENRKIHGPSLDLS